MQADDIAAYFTKKIAKPIAFDLLINDGSHRGNHRFYAIEPTAVLDGILHALVSLKHETTFGGKKARSEHIGEVNSHRLSVPSSAPSFVATRVITTGYRRRVFLPIAPPTAYFRLYASKKS